MRLLIAHTNLQILQKWSNQLSSHEIHLAADVLSLTTQYVACEPDFTFVGVGINFPTQIGFTALGSPDKVFRVETVEEIFDYLKHPTETFVPNRLERQSGRFSIWSKDWPKSGDKLRPMASDDEIPRLGRLIEGAVKNQRKLQLWSENFDSYHLAVVAESAYRISHGSRRAISHLRDSGLRLCGALSCYLPQADSICRPTPIHPRISFIARNPPPTSWLAHNSSSRVA